MFGKFAKTTNIGEKFFFLNKVKNVCDFKVVLCRQPKGRTYY